MRCRVCKFPVKSALPTIPARLLPRLPAPRAAEGARRRGRRGADTSRKRNAGGVPNLRPDQRRRRRRAARLSAPRSAVARRVVAPAPQTQDRRALRDADGGKNGRPPRQNPGYRKIPRCERRWHRRIASSATTAPTTSCIDRAGALAILLGLARYESTIGTRGGIL